MSAPALRRPKAASVLKVSLGFALTGLFLWLLLRRVSVEEVAAAFAGFDLRWLPAALLCVVLGYAARITRWWIMLRATGAVLPWGAAARPFLVSIAVNNVAPLRAGDVLRLFAFSGAPGLGPSTVLGTVVVERVLDLAVLLLVFFAVLPFVPADGIPPTLLWAAKLVAGAGAGAVLALVLLPAVGGRVVGALRAAGLGARVPLLGRVLDEVEKLVESVRALGYGTRLLAVLALSGAAWVMEGGAFLMIALALDVPGGAPSAFFALASATLATLVPSSPGYVGTFHYFASQAVSAFGTPLAVAAGYAFAIHFVLWITTSLAGLCAFLLTVASRAGSRAASVEADTASPT